MSINSIDNLESASSIRAKLNEMITIINHYSSSQFTGGPAPGGGGDPYTPPASGTTFWDSSMGSPMGVQDSLSACNAVNMLESHTVYLQKAMANMGGTSVPEVNDFVYSDEAYMMPVSEGYYGYRDDAMMMNKFIFVDMTGMITQISYCA